MWRSTEQGGGPRWRPGRGLAGAVSPGQRRKKKTSSFPLARSGAPGWVGFQAELLGRLGGLVRWASVQVSPSFFSV
jgi:hypothetical protein